MHLRGRMWKVAAGCLSLLRLVDAAAAARRLRQVKVGTTASTPSRLETRPGGPHQPSSLSDLARLLLHNLWSFLCLVRDVLLHTDQGLCSSISAQHGVGRDRWPGGVLTYIQESAAWRPTLSGPGHSCRILLPCPCIYRCMCCRSMP